MIQLKPKSSACWHHFGMIKPSLGLVFFDFVNRLREYGITDVIITSIIRKKTTDSGVHEFGRAIDISASFPEDIGKRVMEDINKDYIYDTDRLWIKTCIYHKTEFSDDPGWHFHLQVRG